MNLEKMYSLKDRLFDELVELSEQGMTLQNLDAMDKLARTAKNIHKLIKCEDEGASSYGGGDWTAHGSYGRDGGYARNGYSRDSGSYGRDEYSRDGEYSMMDGDTEHSYANRDYRGRYSRSSGDSREIILENLRKMREQAKDNSERSAIAKVMNQMNALK